MLGVTFAEGVRKLGQAGQLWPLPRLWLACLATCCQCTLLVSPGSEPLAFLDLSLSHVLSSSHWLCSLSVNKAEWILIDNVGALFLHCLIVNASA